MPILAMPVVESLPPPPRDMTAVDSRSLAFRALDGTYPFTPDERMVIFGPDAEGLDLPPRELITRTVPGMEGARLSEIRVGSREVFLPLALHSASAQHLELLNLRDQLARLFNHRLVDYVAADGTFDLVATSLRGERSLRCIYSDGMTTGGMAPDGRALWQKLGVTLMAVRPYWQGPNWSTPVIRTPAPVPWFGAFPPGLTSSQAIGLDLRVTVEGDVESWATIDVMGPATSVLITGPGLSVSIPGGLAEGEPARIVTDPRSRTALFSGDKDWSRVAPSDRYQPLRPGDQYLTIAMAGATAASSAVVFGPTLWERPW